MLITVMRSKKRVKCNNNNWNIEQCIYGMSVCVCVHGNNFNLITTCCVFVYHFHLADKKNYVMQFHLQFDALHSFTSVWCLGWMKQQSKVFLSVFFLFIVVIFYLFISISKVWLHRKSIIYVNTCAVVVAIAISIIFRLLLHFAMIFFSRMCACSLLSCEFSSCFWNGHCFYISLHVHTLYIFSISYNFI